ncbi:MAG: glycosyltransferase family 2 protein [Desulfuromonadaceae bacterium]|nr:glycosyltransferase family 2 protein [Desulfuromonadaceae bacterium]MDD5104160.1 glycosyltransferase family 2 protein [Desulfuromonadaceae bacterium]
MKIELITMWYNEEFLAPFFLNHYSWVDKIHILLDADTDDNTEKIAARYPNVSVEYFKFPNMMDDLIKSRKINEKYRSITDADYIIVVDSDEFILCNRLTDVVKDHIILKDKSIYFAVLWQIYQHEHDIRPDPSKPVYPQRRHGDPTIANCNIKPVVVKAGLNLVWGVGNHSVVLDGKHMSWLTPHVDVMSEHGVSVRPVDMMQGAHWRLFDLNETINRRIRNRANRQSQVNLSTNLSSHLHKTSVNEITAEFNRMKGCPVVLQDRICSSDCGVEHTSIFEALLADNSYSGNYEANQYPYGVSHMFECSEVPDWYISVRPQSSFEALVDETFLLACEYHKNGNRDKAITLLKKALLSSPDSEHYNFYLLQWQNEVREPGKCF